MTRIFLIVGWLLVCLDLIVAATLLFSSDSGDAATRGVAPGLGAALLVVGLIAAALLFCATDPDQVLREAARELKLQ